MAAFDAAVLNVSADSTPEFLRSISDQLVAHKVQVKCEIITAGLKENFRGLMPTHQNATVLNTSTPET